MQQATTTNNVPHEHGKNGTLKKTFLEVKNIS